MSSSTATTATDTDTGTSSQHDQQQQHHNELEASFNGQEIAKLLRTDGPIVSCVLLRALAPVQGEKGETKASTELEADSAKKSDVNADGTEPSTSAIHKSITPSTVDVNNIDTATDTATDSTNDSTNDNTNDSTNSSDDTKKQQDAQLDTQQPERIILKDQISQIMVDTTPKKSMVSLILGGPFTFLGQYEEEGIVVMIRRQPEMSEDDGSGDDEEESDKTGGQCKLIRNPHQLQPPLHDAKVYGDILLMRVAPCDEDAVNNEATTTTTTNTTDNDKSDNDINAKKSNATENEATSSSIDHNEPSLSPPQPKLLSNEEFFLNYTIDEYIKFASRTDILPPPPQQVNDEEKKNEDDMEIGQESDSGSENGSGSDEDDDKDGNNDGDDDDEDYDDDDLVDEYDEDDEDCQISMMNLILAQIIKRFREENGRGPNTEELLTMKSALAEKLGIEESINGLGDEDAKDDADEDSDANGENDTLSKDDDNNNDDKKEKDETQGDGKTNCEDKPQDDTKTKASKRKSEGKDGGRQKRVKFTNKDHVRLIPGLELRDDDDALEEGEGEI
jgi:hypothetical protein